MSFYENLIFGNSKKKAPIKSELVELYQKPKKDTVLEAPSFSRMAEDIVHQMDLIYLPNDGGYQYALVVVDQGTRKTDAVALKEHSAGAVLKGLRVIYDKHDILSQPNFITVDSGSEFKGDFAKAIQKLGISIKVARIGRHRQVGLAERKNQTIGTLIHKKIVQDEIDTGYASSQWKDDLQTIIKLINKKTAKMKPRKIKLTYEDAPRITERNSILLNVGDRVRLQLDEPHQHNNNRKLHGRFRAGDIRWTKDIYTIAEILLKPNQPPMYMVDGINNAAYTRNQLQLTTSKPVEPKVDEENNRFEVEKLVDRKTENGVVYFKVKWHGYSVKEATWEKRTSLMKDIPQLIARFERKLNNKK
jgi:hypothetical protein